MNNTIDTNQITVFMFDLDGVIWLSGEILPGVAEILQFLDSAKIHSCYLTNNSAASCEKVANRISTSGYQADANTVYTSAMATAHYLKHHRPDAKVLLLGSANLHDTIVHSLIPAYKLTPEINPDQIDYSQFTDVVMGIDWTVNYAMLKACCYAVQSGCGLIGSNADFSYPFLGGMHGPGAGSFISVVAGVTHTQPVIIGKPEPYLYQYACAQLLAQPHQTVIVGDRLDTDIELANRVGAPSILIETGIDKREKIIVGKTAVPTMVFHDLVECLDWLKESFYVG